MRVIRSRSSSSGTSARGFSSFQSPNQPPAGCSAHRSFVRPTDKIPCWSALWFAGNNIFLSIFPLFSPVSYLKDWLRRDRVAKPDRCAKGWVSLGKCRSSFFINVHCSSFPLTHSSHPLGAEWKHLYAMQFIHPRTLSSLSFGVAGFPSGNTLDQIKLVERAAYRL